MKQYSTELTSKLEWLPLCLPSCSRPSFILSRLKSIIHTLNNLVLSGESWLLVDGCASKDAAAKLELEQIQFINWFFLFLRLLPIFVSPVCLDYKMPLTVDAEPSRKGSCTLLVYKVATIMQINNNKWASTSFPFHPFHFTCFSQYALEIVAGLSPLW